MKIHRNLDLFAVCLRNRSTVFVLQGHRKLRILVLHGFRENAARSRGRLRGLMKRMQRTADLIFIDAPHALAEATTDFPASSHDVLANAITPLHPPDTHILTETSTEPVTESSTAATLLPMYLPDATASAPNTHNLSLDSFVLTTTRYPTVSRSSSIETSTMASGLNFSNAHSGHAHVHATKSSTQSSNSQYNGVRKPKYAWFIDPKDLEPTLGAEAGFKVGHTTNSTLCSSALRAPGIESQSVERDRHVCTADESTGLNHSEAKSGACLVHSLHNNSARSINPPQACTQRLGVEPHACYTENSTPSTGEEALCLHVCQERQDKGRIGGAYTLEEEGVGREDVGGGKPQHDTQVSGWQESVAAVRRACDHYGPFDGLLAFSQGCSMAALLLGLQQLAQSLPTDTTVASEDCFMHRVTIPDAASADQATCSQVTPSSTCGDIVPSARSDSRVLAVSEANNTGVCPSQMLTTPTPCMFPLSEVVPSVIPVGVLPLSDAEASVSVRVLSQPKQAMIEISKALDADHRSPILNHASSGAFTVGCASVKQSSLDVGHEGVNSEEVAELRLAASTYHWSFRFAMLCSGYVSKCPALTSVLELVGPLAVPSLHVFGTSDEDRQVFEPESRALVAVFDPTTSQVMAHDKGHIIPSTRSDVAKYTEFFATAMIEPGSQ